jgi:hypothetical protein
MDLEQEQPKDTLNEQQIEEFLRQFDSQPGYSQNLSGEPEKLSDAPHEIVFNITANVLEENEKGEKIRSKHICTKFYHIPVPIDGDYHIFMESFFKFLEEALSSSASQAYDKTNPHKNTTHTEDKDIK